MADDAEISVSDATLGTIAFLNIIADALVTEHPALQGKIATRLRTKIGDADQAGDRGISMFLRFVIQALEQSERTLQRSETKGSA